MKCRWMAEGAADGAWNMAVDEAMLDSVVAGESSGPTLRWYQWAEPTISLGYFQSMDDLPAELVRLPVVRRLTGGGAILHDRELTYSLAVPAGAWPRGTAKEMVQLMHQFIADALGGPIAPQGEVVSSIAPEPFLCFARRSDADLVQAGEKIVGSAQRTRRGALLQHGSILLSPSDKTPQLTGLGVQDWRRKAGLLVKLIMDQCRKSLDWQFEEGGLAEQEIHRAETLVREKYRQDGWNRRR